MVVFQAVSWEAFDNDKGRYEVCIFGRTEDGESVCVRTYFNPYFFVKKTNKHSTLTASQFKTAVKERLENRLTNDVSTYSEIVKGLSMIKRKDLMYFQDSSEYVFVKIDFASLGAMKKCERVCHDLFKGSVYEANLEPFLRLMHRTGIKSTGWLQVDDNKCMKTNKSTCDIELFTKNWKILEAVDRDDIAPFKIVSFDIETNSSTGKFPDPTEEGDAIFQIALTTKCYGSPEITDKVCLCYKKTSGEDVISYDTEKELLMAFTKKIIELDPDAITGYNIFGFDLDFIWNRGQMFFDNIEHPFYYMGRLKDHESVQVKKKLSSGALGDNVLKLLPMKGRYIFDLFHEIKREKKLDSYSLNNVSKTFLGDQKIDMPAREMFKRFVEGDPDKLGEVADYCLKDTMLPHKLIDKLCIFTNLVEMAKATWVPLSYLSERAQQIKVFSQITRKARDLGFVVPTIKLDKNKIPNDKYEGATVLEAHKDAYYTPITALDFASLYPSIMMAHNMCFSTLVIPGSKFDNLDGVEYEEFEAGGNIYKFAQNVPSLLPVILNELKQFRKKAKKLMAQTRGTPMEEVYNGQQLAYKISMNSIYGFCGARLGMLPCVPIAASVTSQGRKMINMTKQRVETKFPGAIVRYGDTDSVMVEFPCPGMSQEEAIKHSWKLGEEAAELCNEMFKKPNDLELEKVYCPYILYSKKRYAAKMWTQDKNGEMEMEKIDVKGLQLVRRDNTPYTREVSKEVLNKILESSDPEPAINLALERAKELLDGKVDMSKLIMSKSLSDTYKTKLYCKGCGSIEGELCKKGCKVKKREKSDKWSYSAMMNEEFQNLPAQPHVHVVHKMNIREPGSHPHTGDRVPFVLVDTGNPAAKMFERAEDPKYVSQQEDVKLDYLYYFTNQLKKPIEDLLDPLIKGRDIFRDLIPPKPLRGKKAVPKYRRIDEMFKAFQQ